MKFKPKTITKLTFNAPKTKVKTEDKPTYSLPPEMYFKMFLEWSKASGLNNPVLPEIFVDGADIAELCFRYNVTSFKYNAGCYFLTLE